MLSIFAHFIASPWVGGQTVDNDSNGTHGPTPAIGQEFFLLTARVSFPHDPRASVINLAEDGKP
jgi:hypothetical protein